ncbi:MAG: AraC family transcriptional regulator [Lacibacter sp.]
MDKILKYCTVPIDENRSFIFDHVHIAWNEQITFHQHAEPELSYILKGSGIRVVGNLVEPFTAGEVVFLPSNIPHSWSFDPNDYDEEGKIENITILFPTSLFDKCIQVFPETRPHILKIKQWKQAIRFQGNILQQLQMNLTAMRWQNDMERLSSFINLFSIIASSEENLAVGSRRKQNRNAVKLQDIYRFIYNNYQREISLDDVASYVRMNRTSFCVFFKRATGKSFFSSLNEYRINSSCLMLRETTKPIADICYAAGFNDIPHYNRTFKKLKGVTPKEYRSKKLQ